MEPLAFIGDRLLQSEFLNAFIARLNPEVVVDFNQKMEFELGRCRQKGIPSAGK